MNPTESSTGSLGGALESLGSSEWFEEEDEDSPIFADRQLVRLTGPFRR